MLSSLRRSIRSLNEFLVRAVLIIIYIPVFGLAKALSMLMPARRAGWTVPADPTGADSSY